MDTVLERREVYKVSTIVICALLETLPQARHKEVGVQRQQPSSWGTETPWRAWLLRQQLEFLRKSKGEEVSCSEYKSYKKFVLWRSQTKEALSRKFYPKSKFQK